MELRNRAGPAASSATNVSFTDNAMELLVSGQGLAFDAKRRKISKATALEEEDADDA